MKTKHILLGLSLGLLGGFTARDRPQSKRQHYRQ